MMFLVDTNVISEIRKVGTPLENRAVAEWARATPQSSLYTSVVVVEELEIGVLRLERRDAVSGARLRFWLDTVVKGSFAGRILPVDEAIAQRSASLHVPDPRPIRDAYLAATAMVHGLTIATRNVRDFAPTHIPIFNPWND